MILLFDFIIIYYLSLYDYIVINWLINVITSIFIYLSV